MLSWSAVLPTAAVSFLKQSQKRLNEIQQLDSGEIVELFPITPHCFRHSFATICYEAGIDPRQAAEIFGDTPQVLEAVYTHLRDGHKRSAGEKLAEYVSALENSVLNK